MHWEVEQKFAIHDLPATAENLAQLGAQFSQPLQQIDHYFNHPARDFSQTDEALRIRQVGENTFVTYKGPKIDPSTKTRRELELPLPPGSKISNQFSELLTALGFRYVAAVSKTRRIAKFAWQNQQVEAALDDVIGLGRFLELEITADETAIESAKSALHSLAQTLGLRNSERRSYLELLLEKSP